jgi:hypothetical protein
MNGHAWSLFNGHWHHLFSQCGETHASLTALEQQALASSHLPACSGALIHATNLSWRSAKR